MEMLCCSQCNNTACIAKPKDPFTFKNVTSSRHEASNRNLAATFLKPSHHKASQTLAMEFIMRPMSSQIISTGDGMGRLYVHVTNHSTLLWLLIALPR